eukprot:363936-Chlamydomonas_euryale.AAC.2
MLGRHDSSNASSIQTEVSVICIRCFGGREHDAGMVSLGLASAVGIMWRWARHGPRSLSDLSGRCAARVAASCHVQCRQVLLAGTSPTNS